MDWQDGLRDLLKRDIARFHQGIKLIEAGHLTVSDASATQPVDRTQEYLEWYRSSLSALERTLTLLETHQAQ